MAKSSQLVKCPKCNGVIKSKGKFLHFSQSHEGEDYDEWKNKEWTPVSNTNEEESNTDESGSDDPNELDLGEPHEPDSPPLPPIRTDLQQPRQPAPDTIQDSPTPNDILEETLTIDPKLSEERTNWILSHIDLYGVLSTAEVSDLIQSLNISSAGKTARRVTKRYSTALQHALNKDPSLQHEEQWRDLIYKETGQKTQPNPSNPGPTIAPPPTSRKDTSSDTGSNLIIPDNPDHTNSPLNDIKTQMQQAGVNLDTDLDQTIDKIVNTQMKMQLLSSIKDGSMFNANGNHEKHENEALKQELQNQREKIDQTAQALQHVAERIEQLATNPAPQNQDSEPSKDAMQQFSEKMLQRLGDKMLNELNEAKQQDAELTPELVDTIFERAAESTSRIEPNGNFNKYDAEVAKIERQTEAEKAIAKERTKAMTGIADAIRDAADRLGEGVGRGFGSNNAPRRHRQPPAHGHDGDSALMSSPCYNCKKTFEFPADEPEPTCPYCGQVHNKIENTTENEEE